MFADEIADKTPAENIRELYRLLMQRATLENAGYGEVPLEHLMIRKSQRSPSLRLRFGRADPHLTVSIIRPLRQTKIFLLFFVNLEIQKSNASIQANRVGKIKRLLIAFIFQMALLSRRLNAIVPPRFEDN